MPRPVKMRRICQLPAFSLYGPLSKKGNEDQFITMQVEEFEAIRLMDLEGLDQEQCAEKMNVARSTVQRIYNRARKIIADSLVNGKVLKIEGGNFLVCDGDMEMNRCPACFQRRHRHGRNR
jgi:predicted DNA-binding protein (UPF0251 family)